MERRRVGRALRALRRARSLLQSDVADAAGVSQPTVSAIERGRWDAMSVRTLGRVFDAVDADVEMVVRYRGGELDRLLDERHAATASAVSQILRERGWSVLPEVTFNHYGDRGSIDLLAFHPVARVLLVTEVKTEITSAEETLRRLDVKTRIGPLVAASRFDAKDVRVVGLLAVRASTANRDRVARLDSLFGPSFSLRGRELAAWLHAPTSPAPGHRGALMFVRDIGVTDRARRGRRGGRVRRPGDRHS